jgi:HAE1 family hydrophobic/amphiphilic exporter-1
VLGTVVIGGMLAASCVAVCLIPVTFYVVERLARSRSELKPQSPVTAGGQTPAAGTV